MMFPRYAVVDVDDCGPEYKTLEDATIAAEQFVREEDRAVAVVQLLSRVEFGEPPIKITPIESPFR